MQRLALIILVLVAVIIKAPQVLAPMGQDQGLYHTAAQRIVSGGVMYRDVWDPKTPGVFYTHAALLAPLADPWRPCQVGYLQPRCGRLVLGVFDFAWSLAIAALAWLVARKVGLTSGGALLAFGFTAAFTNLALVDPEGNTPEKYALLPAVGAILCGVHALKSNSARWLVAAGVLGGIAAVYKIPDLAGLGAVALALAARRRWAGMAWLLIPTVLVLVGVAGAFAGMGAGAALLDATVGYNVARFGFESDRIPFAGVLAAWRLFRDGLALLWLPALIGAVAAWQTRQWRLLLAWALFDVMALFLGGTKFTREYFLQLVPSFSLLAAAGLQTVWLEHARAHVARLWVVISLAGVAVLSNAYQGGFTLRVINEYVRAGWTTNSVEHLASMVASLPRDETLFVWGDEAQLYTLSGRVPPTRFLNTAGLAATGDPAAIARRAEVFAALRREPPAILVVDRRTADDDPDGRLLLNVRYVPELQQLLADRYREMDAAVLRPYIGGDREQVFIRTNGPDLCALMPDCHLA